MRGAYDYDENYYQSELEVIENDPSYAIIDRKCD